MTPKAEINSKYKPEMVHLMNLQPSLSRDRKISGLGNTLSRAIRVIRQGVDETTEEGAESLEAWSEALEQDLFNLDSYEGIEGATAQSVGLLERELIGPLSENTLIDLMEEANSELTGHLVMSDLLSSGEVDVKDKVDLEIKFGDTNPYHNDAEIVRLVQLKASRDGEVGVWRVDPSDIRGDYLDYVGFKDIKRMSSYAEAQERKSSTPLDAQIFVVVVPGYTSPQVDNMLGIIRKDKDEIVSNFESMATKSGFLPQERSAGV